MSHTPGPWQWRDFGGNWILHGDYGGRPVVLCASVEEESIVESASVQPGLVGTLCVRSKDCVLVPLTPDHPDARLIKAAPDLLEACKRARDCLKNMGMDWLGKDADPLDAAIAKATGEIPQE